MNELSTINVSTASLPKTYEAAQTALAECASLDECQDWADKAAALASYARQAKDDQLERMAQRIRARAIRRAGELLKQIEPGQGARDGKREEGDHPPLRYELAASVGMSPHQAKQAIRVASVPSDVFDTCVDDDKPATITQLAEMGKRDAPKPLVDLNGRDPKAFNKSLHFVGMIEDYGKELAGYDVGLTIGLLDSAEAATVRRLIGKIDSIHDQIITRI